MPSAGERIRRLQTDLGDLQEAARRLTDELANRGDPQTSEATLVFQRLTGVLVRVFDLKDPPSIDDIAGSLEATAGMCTGSLAPLKAEADRLAAIARG